MTDPEADTVTGSEEGDRDALRVVLDTNVPTTILACAFVGRASHIVTYDPHFDVLGGAYQGIPILDGCTSSMSYAAIGGLSLHAEWTSGKGGVVYAAS